MSPSGATVPPGGMQALVRRRQEALGQAADLCQRSLQAVSEAAALIAQTAQARDRARFARASSRPQRRAFMLRGRIEREAVMAVAKDGQLYLSASLAERADLLGRLGEVVPDGRGGQAPASLEGCAIAVTCTLMRACDTVTDVEMGLWEGAAPGAVAGKPVLL